MPSRTRFNPTANGLLHVGHAYMALVNETEAHLTDGEFIVRIEDNQEYWVWRTTPEGTKHYCEEIRRDFDWLGLNVDRYTLQSDTHEAMQEALKYFMDGKPFELQRMLSFYAAEVHGMYEYVFYPYAPYLTIIKALEDGLDAINLLIRGIDLLSEHALYQYCCEIIRFLPPRMVYLPRMLTKERKQIAPLSKTEGGHKIADFRKHGYKPADVMELLRASCLVDPDGPWVISNVKAQPIWVG